MRFCEFAQGIYQYCARGMNSREFTIALLGSIVDDEAIDRCEILNAKPDTAYRYFTGDRNFDPKKLTFITGYLDKGKFQDWLLEDATPDVIAGLSSFLVQWNVGNNGTYDDVGEKCADLFEQILLEATGAKIQAAKSTSLTNGVNDDEDDMSRILGKVDQIEQLIGELPKPKSVPVPDEILEDESSYINELLSAYGDAEKVEGFSKTDLPRYPAYSEDLSERRIDYFAAETIRRGVLELAHGKLAGQFDVLKAETLTGVKDTERQKHDNGYERMLAVMMQATVLPVSNYVLSNSHYWISNSIKKGVCHVLVNDGKLKWVKKK